MSSKALSKKTFEIKNETWLIFSFFIIFGIILIRTCLAVTEKQLAGNQYNEYDNAVEGHIFLSMLCMEVGFISLISLCLPPKHYRKIFIANFIYSFFLTLFFFDPFIFEYIRLAEKAAKDYKCSLIFHFISIPVVLANSYFITYVLWRMSKVKPDYDGEEPYLVIYGGEGSSTKHIDLDSE